MKSKSWSKRSAPACAISLLCYGLVAARFPGAMAQTAHKKSPALALLDDADAAQWRKWTGDLGWQVVTPAAGPANPNIDQRVQALAKAVETFIQSGDVDAGRVYLAARGESAAAVFYAISRVPDLWAAGVALGGSPKTAVDTNRIYAANFTNAPVLWVSDAAGGALAQTLKTAGLNLEWRPASADT